MIGRGIALAALAIALAAGVQVVPTAGADEDIEQVADIETRFLPDGKGEMFAWALRDEPGRTWTWEACAPDLTACADFDAGARVSTAGAEPETVFRATSSDGLSATSPLWHGDLASVAAPSASGAIRANEVVTALPGRWHGGWEGDRDLLQLAACLAPEGAICTTLTDTHYFSGCGSNTALIDRGFAGRYLRVANSRTDGSALSPAFVIGSPYAGTAWAPGATTSVAVVGQIEPAAGPRAARCGPPPLSSVSISKRGVATVMCGLGCRAVLIGKRGRRRARIRRRIAPPHEIADAPSLALRLPRRALTRLGVGRARVVVRIDSEWAAARKVRIRRRQVRAGRRAHKPGVRRRSTLPCQRRMRTGRSWLYRGYRASGVDFGDHATAIC